MEDLQLQNLRLVNLVQVEGLIRKVACLFYKTFTILHLSHGLWLYLSYHVFSLHLLSMD
jgi:hypothetical protein